MKFKPIKITKERLLKWGFKDISFENSDYEKVYHGHKIIERYELAIDNVGCHKFVAFYLAKGWLIQGLVLEYEHQLQNMYFAKTGKELEI